MKNCSEESCWIMKGWITHCINYMRNYGTLMLVFIWRHVSLYFVTLQFLFLHFTHVHILDHLLYVHFSLFWWFINRGNHLFNLQNDRLYSFAFPLIELSAEYIQRLLQFVHCPIAPSLEFQYLLYYGWQFRKLISMFMID